jgi:hypothetical protein
LRAKIFEAAQDTATDVQIQLALTLGELGADAQNKELLLKLSQSEVLLAKEAAKFAITGREPVKTKRRRFRPMTKSGSKPAKPFTKLLAWLAISHTD